MITIAYVRTMAAYNAGMNARLYAAAERLSDVERRADRGAFWRSIHGTLSHLLWADQMWMSRFADWEAPTRALAQSTEGYATFEAMASERTIADTRMTAWAADLDEAWLREDQTWFSGAVGQHLRGARAMLLLHMFNHQTHHRGQTHAMLTAAGQATGDTDLWLVVPGSIIRVEGKR